MRSGSSPLLPLLRSCVQGDLLALLYLHPNRDYSLTEAAALIGASVKTVHTEASRLIAAGFVRDSRRGNIRLLRAVTDRRSASLMKLHPTRASADPDGRYRLPRDAAGSVPCTIGG
jgi:DNA-binding IclR family transcriptional regulator